MCIIRQLRVAFAKAWGNREQIFMIYVAEKCGLCEGAARALRMTEEQLQAPARPIVLYNDLLHNATVMAHLRAQKVHTVHAIEDVPQNATLIVSAHGMPAAHYEYLVAQGIPCVDATCPKVISIHKIVRQGHKNGQAVVIVGKKNHPEVLGIAGWCGGEAVIVQSEEDLPALSSIVEEAVLVVCQSTFNEKKAEALVAHIQKALPGKAVTVKNTICPAQRQIQLTSLEMAKKCDVVFVLGGYNSSNTVELFNLCSAAGARCHHVDSMASFYTLIQSLPLTAKMNIGLTAGASTTKDEIESCRALLAYHLFYTENNRLLTELLTDFNHSLVHKNAVVQQFVGAFAAVNRGGKNLRGILVSLGYQLAGGKNLAHSRPLGLAVEIFQTSILVHDDIIDHAPLRRGLATVPHQYRARYGQALGQAKKEEAADIADSVGICAGDVGFYYANRLLAQGYANDAQLGAVLEYFSQMAINTMYGEVLDVVLPFEEKNGIAQGDREDSVMEIYHLKTAWYSVVGPLCLGMLLAGAGEAHICFMQDFANHLGLAFQIKDDLMGIFAEAEDLGKPMSDMAEYKQTLLYAYVHDQKPSQLPALKRHYGNSPLTPQDVAAVRKIFTQSGALAYAEEKMQALFAAARQKLAGADFVRDEDKRLLLGFIAYLQLRTK